MAAGAVGNKLKLKQWVAMHVRGTLHTCTYLREELREVLVTLLGCNDHEFADGHSRLLQKQGTRNRAITAQHADKMRAAQ